MALLMLHHHLVLNSIGYVAINAMLVSWISNTIDPALKSNLTKFCEAKKFRDHLKQGFAQTNGPHIRQLRSSIAKFNQAMTLQHVGQI